MTAKAVPGFEASLRVLCVLVVIDMHYLSLFTDDQASEATSVVMEFNSESATDIHTILSKCEE